MDNRDVTFVEIFPEVFLAVACNSIGGIGDKPGDVVKVPPYIVGRFGSRVPLMEILAVGATPKSITAAICSEPDPTGEGILEGIRDELESVDLQLPITISTEKNIPTTQTGLGVTVVGVVGRDKLKLNETRSKDKLFSVGLPKVGNEVSLEDPEIADAKLVKGLVSLPAVHDVVPVGSKGIRREAEMLADHLGLRI